jgi:hypothetical protein
MVLQLHSIGFDDAFSMPYPFCASDLFWPLSYYADALHIAAATVYKLDFIVSLNFQHVLRRKTIELTELINYRMGYKKVGIYSPGRLFMKTIDDYLKDPSLVNEPATLREVHAARLKIQYETRNMTAEEKKACYHDGAAAFFAGFGITPKYADFSG